MLLIYIYIDNINVMMIDMDSYFYNKTPKSLSVWLLKNST